MAKAKFGVEGDSYYGSYGGYGGGYSGWSNWSSNWSRGWSSNWKNYGGSYWKNYSWSNWDDWEDWSGGTGGYSRSNNDATQEMLDMTIVDDFKRSMKAYVEDIQNTPYTKSYRNEVLEDYANTMMNEALDAGASPSTMNMMQDIADSNIQHAQLTTPAKMQKSDFDKITELVAPNVARAQKFGTYKPITQQTSKTTKTTSKPKSSSNYQGSAQASKKVLAQKTQKAIQKKTVSQIKQAQKKATTTAQKKLYNSEKKVAKATPVQKQATKRYTTTKKTTTKKTTTKKSTASKILTSIKKLFKR